jgi:hypothetical protein
MEEEEGEEEEELTITRAGGAWAGEFSATTRGEEGCGTGEGGPETRTADRAGRRAAEELDRTGELAWDEEDAAICTIEDKGTEDLPSRSAHMSWA